MEHTEYRGWKQDVCFRRQIVFIKENEPSFTAIDFGKFRDNDREWAHRLFEEIKRKIDLHLGSNFGFNYGAEEYAAKIIRHNFECHKILLVEHQEISAAQAEKEWKLAKGTVRAACVRGVITGRQEKPGTPWLVKRGEMKNHYGRQP